MNKVKYCPVNRCTFSPTDRKNRYNFSLTATYSNYFSNY